MKFYVILSIFTVYIVGLFIKRLLDQCLKFIDIDLYLHCCEYLEPHSAEIVELGHIFHYLLGSYWTPSARRSIEERTPGEDTGARHTGRWPQQLQPLLLQPASTVSTAGGGGC